MCIRSASYQAACISLCASLSLVIMDVFAKCRARIGAARLLLEPLSGQLRDSNSGIQRMAIVALISEKGRFVSLEQSCTLSDQLMRCNFCDSDKTLILEALRDRSSTTTGRRKQQNGMAFLSYLNAPEWASLDKKKLDKDFRGVASVFVDAMVNRMHCVNPTEPTIKFVASATLVVCEDVDVLNTIAMDAKIALKKFVRQRFDFHYKVYMKRWKSNTGVEYCADYPDDPNALGESYPELHKFIMRSLGGTLVPNQLDSLSLTLVDDSHQCRGGSKSMAIVPAQSSPMANMNMPQQFMNCLMQFMNNQGQTQPRQPRQDDLLHNLIVGGGSRKRSAAMLRFLADSNLEDDDAPPPPPAKRNQSLLDRSRTFEDPGGAHMPGEPISPKQKVEANVALEPQQDQDRQEASTPPLKVHPHTPPVVDSQVAPSSKDSGDGAKESKKANTLLDAMLQRDQERAAASAAASKMKRANDKEEKRLAAQGADVTPAKLPAKVAPGKKGGAPMKVAPTTVATPVKSGSKVNKASFSHEASRNQYLCRTGASGPGQSFAIKYGIAKSGKDYNKTNKQAHAEATAWLKTQKGE